MAAVWLDRSEENVGSRREAWRNSWNAVLVRSHAEGSGAAVWLSIRQTDLKETHSSYLADGV